MHLNVYGIQHPGLLLLGIALTAALPAALGVLLLMDTSENYRQSIVPTARPRKPAVRRTLAIVGSVLLLGGIISGVAQGINSNLQYDAQAQALSTRYDVQLSNHDTLNKLMSPDGDLTSSHVRIAGDTYTTLGTATVLQHGQHIQATLVQAGEIYRLVTANSYREL